MVSLQETSSSLALTILAEVQILACDRPRRADPASSESSSHDDEHPAAFADRVSFCQGYLASCC
jgi:hypothetical protein